MGITAENTKTIIFRDPNGALLTNPLPQMKRQEVSLNYPIRERDYGCSRLKVRRQDLLDLFEGKIDSTYSDCGMKITRQTVMDMLFSRMENGKRVTYIFRCG